MKSAIEWGAVLAVVVFLMVVQVGVEAAPPVPPAPPLGPVFTPDVPVIEQPVIEEDVPDLLGTELHMLVGVLDRIVDGKWAVFLVGCDEVEIVFPYEGFVDMRESLWFVMWYDLDPEPELHRVVEVGKLNCR